MSTPLTELLAGSDLIADNASHSVRADVRVLDRKTIADSAHRNFGMAVMKLERLERDCAAAFAELEKRAAEVQELGTRAEPLWERLPILNAGHTVWMSDRVGPAPIRTVSE